MSEPLSENFSLPSLPPNWYESATSPMKLLQTIGISTTFLGANGGDNKLGLTEVDLLATFAVPILYEQAPLLITPGFGFDFWQGPVSVPPANADMPPVTYSLISTWPGGRGSCPRSPPG